MGQMKCILFVLFIVFLPAPAVAYNKPIWGVHVIFASSDWGIGEVSPLYDQIEFAVDYWNDQPIPVRLVIEDESFRAVSLETMNWEQAYETVGRMEVPRISIVVVRQPSWVYDGTALRGHFALVRSDAPLRGIVAHELGHVLGARDHYVWSQAMGWHCDDEPDIMCYGFTPHISGRTAYEIYKYLMPIFSLAE